MRQIYTTLKSPISFNYKYYVLNSHENKLILMNILGLAKGTNYNALARARRLSKAFSIC